MNGIEFKDILSLIPTCVGVVWGEKSNGQVFGCTISSIVSSSIEPNNEEVLFILKKNSQTGSELQQCHEFKISILADNQGDIAKVFASGTPFKAKSDLEHIDEWSSLVLLEFSVELKTQYERTTSVIYIAKVSSIYQNKDLQPLVYHARNYKKISK